MLIKENCHACWRTIEWLNGFLFHILYSNKLTSNVNSTLNQFTDGSYHYRSLHKNDLIELSKFLYSFDQLQVKTFEPHDFDTETLKRINKNPSFYMFDVFNGVALLGYFFLRCFIKRKALMGRIVATTHRNKGIA